MNLEHVISLYHQIWMFYNLELLAASCAAITVIVTALIKTWHSNTQTTQTNKQIRLSIFVNKFPATSFSNQFPNHAYSQESFKGGNSLWMFQSILKVIHKVAYQFMTSNPNPSAHQPLQQSVPALSLTSTKSRKAELKQRLGPTMVKVLLPKVPPPSTSQHIPAHSQSILAPEYTRIHQNIDQCRTWYPPILLKARHAVSQRWHLGFYNSNQVILTRNGNPTVTSQSVIPVLHKSLQSWDCAHAVPDTPAFSHMFLVAFAKVNKNSENALLQWHRPCRDKERICSLVSRLSRDSSGCR